MDGHVQRPGALEDGPEILLVVEAAVGQAVDHGALEAELRDRALQLVRRRFRVRGWDDGETGEAGGVGADRGVQPVVDETGHADGALGVELLHGRGGMGDHLEVDPRLVHLLQAGLPETLQPFAHMGGGAGVERAMEGAQVGVLEVLFQRDDERAGGHGEDFPRWGGGCGMGEWGVSRGGRSGRLARRRGVS